MGVPKNSEKIIEMVEDSLEIREYADHIRLLGRVAERDLHDLEQKLRTMSIPNHEGVQFPELRILDNAFEKITEAYNFGGLKGYKVDHLNEVRESAKRHLFYLFVPKVIDHMLQYIEKYDFLPAQTSKRGEKVDESNELPEITGGTVLSKYSDIGYCIQILSGLYRSLEKKESDNAAHEILSFLWIRIREMEDEFDTIRKDVSREDNWDTYIRLHLQLDRQFSKELIDHLNTIQTILADK